MASYIANDEKEDSSELSNFKDTVLKPDYKTQIIHSCAYMQIFAVFFVFFVVSKGVRQGYGPILYVVWI